MRDSYMAINQAVSEEHHSSIERDTSRGAGSQRVAAAAAGAGGAGGSGGPRPINRRLNATCPRAGPPLDAAIRRFSRGPRGARPSAYTYGTENGTPPVTFDMSPGGQRSQMHNLLGPGPPDPRPDPRPDPQPDLHSAPWVAARGPATASRTTTALLQCEHYNQPK
jgi:hypothetical protein